MSPGDETQVVSKSPCNDNSECPTWVKYNCLFFTGFWYAKKCKWKYICSSSKDEFQSPKFGILILIQTGLNTAQTLGSVSTTLSTSKLVSWYRIVNNWWNHCHIDFIHHHLDSIAVSLFTNTDMAMLFTTTTTISTSNTTSTTITTAISIILLITRLPLCNPWWLSRGLLFGPLRTRLWRLGIICKSLLLFEIQRYDLLNYFVGSVC